MRIRKLPGILGAVIIPTIPTIEKLMRERESRVDGVGRRAIQVFPSGSFLPRSSCVRSPKPVFSPEEWYNRKK